MYLSFEFDSIKNTRVIDSTTNRALYEISTELGVPRSGQTLNLNSTTTLRRVPADAVTQEPPGGVVAVWECVYDRDDDRVTLHGERKKLADWLRQKDAASRRVRAASAIPRAQC